MIGKKNIRKSYRKYSLKKREVCSLVLSRRYKAHHFEHTLRTPYSLDQRAEVKGDDG